MALELTEEQAKAGWTVQKLGDIAEIIMGQSPKGENVNTNGTGLPLLNGPTEFTSYHPAPVKWTEQVTKIAEKNDILFCVRGSTTGRMNIADQSYVIGRGLATIRGKNKADTRYIYFLIQLYLPEWLNVATGSTFPNISGVQLNKFKVVWPPEIERSRIAEILGSLDDKIEANNAFIDSLSELAIAEIERLGIFSGEADGVLEDIIEFSPKVAKPVRDSYQFVDMSVLPTSGPVAGQTQVKDKWTGSKFIEGDTLFSRITPCLENGKTAIAMGLGSEPAVGSTEFIVMRARGLNRELLAYGIARSRSFREIAIQKMTGTSGRQRVKWQDLAVIPVSTARLDEFSLGSTEFELLRSLRQENIDLANTRDLLIQNLIGR